MNLGKGNGFTIGRGPKSRRARALPTRIRSRASVRAPPTSRSTELLGAVEAKTASGEVSLEDVVSADIRRRAETCASGMPNDALSIRTLSGDVTVGRCRGMLSINLVSGDLVGRRGRRGIPGRHRVGRCARSRPPAAVRCRSVPSRATFTSRSSRARQLYIDASSLSGDMSSELELEDAPSAGSDGPVRELSIRTVSGDVQIVRAAVARA